MSIFSESLSEIVPANGAKTQSYQIQDGQTIEIIEAIGNAAFNSETNVEIYYVHEAGEQLIFTTYGDFHKKDMNKRFTGSGTSRSIRTDLVNNLSTPKALACEWKGTITS